MATEIEKVEGTFALSISEKDIALLKSQYDMFRELQRQVLQPEVDYGWPAGNKNSKPSLYKSGAEKLTRLFNLLPRFELLKSVEEQGFVYYMFKCVLLTPNGLAIGEGYGSCNSNEKAGWQKNPLAFANNILKMAKKRAHVDATLTGLGASNVFTQDLEDYTEENTKQETVKESPVQKESGRPITEKQQKLIHVLINDIADATETGPEIIEAEIKQKFGIEHFSEINTAKASEIISSLKEELQQIQAGA